MRGRNGGHGDYRARMALAATSVAVLAAACSSSGNEATSLGAGDPASSAASSASTRSQTGLRTTTTLDANSATILARYRAAQAAFLAVAGHYPVVPTDTRLPQFMTGMLLTTVRSRLTTYALAGEYVQGTAELGPTVTSVTGDQAIVNDCGFDHTVVVDGRTGHPVGNAADTQRTQVKVIMQLVEGVWKMAVLEKVGSGCVPPAS